jgi:hypothetical protein
MSKPVALGLLACNPKWPLWSELATKLTATRSVPEALEAYTKCVSQRMQMTAEHGQRVFKDCQQITQKITKSLTNGWPEISILLRGMLRQFCLAVPEPTMNETVQTKN